MIERPNLLRNVVASVPSGPEVVVPVRLGERTQFVFYLAAQLSISPQGHRWVLRRGQGSGASYGMQTRVWLRGEESSGVQSSRPVAFATETQENTIRADDWKNLFPSDYDSKPDVFVPFLGRILWKKMVDKGELSGKERVVTIDVDTGEHKVFDEMSDALRWAKSRPKPTTYFHYEPRFWRGKTLDKRFLGSMYATTLEERAGLTVAEIAKRVSLDFAEAERYAEYLADIEREWEPQPKYRGVAKVQVRGKFYFEAISDNPDVRRDYDFRATNEGGRDFSPKNMFYYMWAWINMAEEKCRTNALPNNRTILITHDCRYYPSEIIEAAKRSALLRGYKVAIAFAENHFPSCVSSYSHAVRVVQPVLAVFVTASHVSRAIENTVVGAKVSMLGPNGRLESLTTEEIKITTARELASLKARDDLYQEVNLTAECREVDVGDSHTRMAVAAVLASSHRLPGVTLYSLAQDLKTAPDIDALLRRVLPGSIPPIFQELRVVIEAAHTSSGLLAEKPFKALGAQITLLHEDVRAIQGPHNADPSITANLSDLFEAMAAQDAHIGLAFDLDGDRGALVLRDREGVCLVLAPDKLGQVLMPFLMQDGEYDKAAKPLYIRDCLSTDALLDQGRICNVTVDTTDAGYVYLKKRENERAAEGFLTMAMGEASGHAWLDFTGPFENPIVLGLLFATMCVQRVQSRTGSTPSSSMPSWAFEEVFTELAIPYRKSPRFQPLFAPQLLAEVAGQTHNDTGWRPDANAPIPQKLISLCRSTSIAKLKEFFTEGKTFATRLGELKVERFEVQWDEEEHIYRFGKIYFSLNGVPIGSFVSRGSSNDPTAVQVWEVKEFEGLHWSGQKLPDAVVEQRFHLIGGLVLSMCAELNILELIDRMPAANMAAVLPSVSVYQQMMKERSAS
jgi:phosphomannomutase